MPLRFLTAGESHGPALTVIVEGLPAGLRVDLEAIGEICRRHGISSATFYTWRKKYGGMEASDARRLKALEAENAKLKRMYADKAMEADALKDLIEKKL